MKPFRLLASTLLLLCCVSLPAADGDWETLFDGTSTAKWRGFRKAAFPAQGWVIEDGALRFQKGSGGGDLVTREQFADFELEFEWKVSEGANSGVMYRVSEAFEQPWFTGPEYQVLDDSKHADGKNPLTSAGALYALIAAGPEKETRPVGEWNRARIILRDRQLEHWLNGRRVVATTLGGDEFNALVASSKFKDMPRFARESGGHICLQDHGDDVWFRNIRVRRLDAAVASGEWRDLFDGRTTAGWRGFGKPAFPAAGWVVEDGWLRHLPKGGGGDIITEAKFTDFEFEWEWKITTGGNSGVKYLIDEARRAPIGHEYQLLDDAAHPDAKAGPKRHTGSLYDALPPANARPNPPGEVNRSRIVVRGRQVEHWLNGTQVLAYELESPALATAKEASKFKGEAKWGTKFATPILLQDHSDEVWFRNLRVRELAP